MMEQLPEGKSIGWMQAPPQWIFTHTIRFVGIVRIVIQDGEGFMLIDKGKILSYYFKHGRIELRGNAALDYFNSNPNVEFNLCKYTPDEMAEAMKALSIGEPESLDEEKKPAPARPAPAQPEPVPPESVDGRSQTTPVPEPAAVLPGEPEQPEPEAGAGTASGPSFPPAPADSTEHDEEFLYEKPAAEEGAVFTQPPTEVTLANHGVPAPAFLEDPDIKVIGQIKKLNGIVAISVFNDERNIMVMGDVEIEPLLKIARSMLGTTRKVSPLIDWGPFIHMTLQIPEGNVIIAPYRDNYLCLLTTRTINIGHIRRILRDLIQNDENAG